MGVGGRLGPVVGVALLAAAGTARAGGPTVDWARGLVIAGGVGVADRHAPSPAVARGTSRRTAEEAARKALAAALEQLPLATGGKVGDHLDKAVKQRLAGAVAAAISLDAEPETDGAWRVTMAVPIEAVRQALTGPRALPPAGDAGDPVVVVDGATATPAVGWKVGTLEAATVWVTAVPAWAKTAPHVRATAARHGRIAIDGSKGGPATLFVIVGGA